MNARRWRLIFLIVLVTGFFHLLFYAVWVPPWQFPDEPRHFEYVRLIYEVKRPLGWDDGDPSLEAAIIRSMARFDFWRFGFAVGGYVQHRDQVFAEIWTSAYQNVLFHPPLYYALVGTITGFLPRSAMVSQLFLLRLLSVLLGTLNLLLIGLIGVVLGGWRRGASLAAFAALVPGHVFINASVNNDVLAETLSLLTIWAGLVLMRRGVRWDIVLLLLGFLLLAVYTKRSTVFLIPYGALSVAVGWWNRRSYRITHKWVYLAGGLAFSVGVVLVFGIVAWRWGRVQQITAFLERFSSPSAFVQAWQEAPLRLYVVTVFESFWARLGWLNVFLPRWVYGILWGSTVLSLIGWIPILRRWWRESTSAARLTGMVILVTLLIQWGMVVGKEILYLSGPLRMLPQGRYLYPFMPFYALFYVEGWSEWCRRLSVPSRTVIFGFLSLISLLAAWTLISFYYGG